MARSGNVYMHDRLAGKVSETESGGYTFRYEQKYFENKSLPPVSLTLPITEVPYTSNVLFAFFDGLIPEGWLLEMTIKNWKLNQRDRFGLLLSACADCIGAVRVESIDE